jgi:flagellar biosynthetic protein FliP
VAAPPAGARARCCCAGPGCAGAAHAVDLLANVVPGAKTELTVKMQILIIMTLLGLLPVMVMMMTSFTRFVIVLSLLRQALGLQQGLPNRVSPAWP